MPYGLDKMPRPGVLRCGTLVPKEQEMATEYMRVYPPLPSSFAFGLLDGKRGNKRWCTSLPAVRSTKHSLLHKIVETTP